MKRVIVFLLLCAMTIALNISLGKGERSEFAATELPSSLTEGEKRVVDTGIPGNLTFGPYVALKKGNYELQIEYESDTDINTWDVFSNSKQLTFGQGILEAGKTVASGTFYLDASYEDIEVRTYYYGEGTLAISKIAIIRELDVERILVNLLFLVLSILVFTLKKKSYRECVVLFFGGLLFCPMLCTAAQTALDWETDVTLEGNFETYERPEAGVREFVDGEYQEEYELWWNNSFSPRGRLIKTYNQIRYSLFGLGNRIIGENGDVFEEDYINEALGLKEEMEFSSEENKAKLKAYYETLVRLQEKLSERGKVLLVYTTPNKAVERKENLPDNYRLLEEEDTLRAIEVWKNYAADGALNYLDTTEYLQGADYPLFYLSGIHWTRPAEQQVSALLVEELNKLSEQKLNKMNFGELLQSDEPFWRDTDVYDLLNVYRGKKDEVYYEYETRVNTKNSPVRVLMQGDSFALGFRQDFKDNNLGASIVNIFYNEYVIEANDAYVPITSWEDFDFGKYLDEADVVLLEMNEALLYTCNRGFAEALEQWLDQGAESEDAPEALNVSEIRQNIDFSCQMDFSKNLIRGYYHAEDGFCWMAKKSLAVVPAEAMREKGLRVELIVPKELEGAKQIMVTVNGKLRKVCTTDVGVHSLVFSPEELPKDGEILEVEIVCDSVFNPKQQGLSADDRDLSVQIIYIGECK